MKTIHVNGLDEAVSRMTSDPVMGVAVIGLSIIFLALWWVWR